MNFKIGDRVICINAKKRLHLTVLSLKEGAEYTVESFVCCPGCGEQGIVLVEIYKHGISECSCGEMFEGRIGYRLNRFTKPNQYRAKVSIPELLTIKEPQLS